MFAFINRVFNNWAGAERPAKLCTCGYGRDQNECPYCSDDGTVSGDLGLSRSDINFYFAAISVCSPFIASFGLPAQTELIQESEQPIRTTSIRTAIGTSIISEIFPEVGRELEDQQTDQTPVVPPFSSDNSTASRVVGRRYDCTNLFRNSSGPQERYYVPKSSRINRYSTFPSSQPEPDATAVAGSQSSVISPSAGNSEAVSQLRRVLEEYRMVVTNSVDVVSANITKPTSVVVSVSFKSLLKNSQMITETTSDLPSSSTAPSSSPSRGMEQITSNNNEPTAFVVTIPTPAVNVPTPVPTPAPSVPPSGIPPSPKTPSKMIRHLLSSSPELERELRERAADVWGMAVGHEDQIIGTDQINNRTTRTESNEGEMNPSDEYRKKRDSLKLEIRRLLMEFGLTDKFEKEMLVVKKGNSKFHQAQQVVPGLW